jgi:hypothetical protein
VLLREHRGAVCPECIATALALPPWQVAITTQGLDNRRGFVTEPDALCSRCGTRGRVIRAVAESPPSSPPGEERCLNSSWLCPRRNGETAHKVCFITERGGCVDWLWCRAHHRRTVSR